MNPVTDTGDAVTMADAFVVPMKRSLDAADQGDTTPLPPSPKKRRIKRIIMEEDEEEEDVLQPGQTTEERSFGQAFTPEEVDIRILEFVGPSRDLLACRLVCKRWSRLVFGTIDYPYPPNSDDHDDDIEYAEEPPVEPRKGNGPLSMRGFVDAVHKYRDSSFVIGPSSANMALGGCLDKLRWFRAQNFLYEFSVCEMAARGGHLHVIRWALANRFPWGVNTLTGAIKNGDVRTIVWLLANGCPLESRACNEAAGNGNLSLLKLLRIGHNCPWSNLTLEAAIDCGFLDVFEWAIRNGCPYRISTLHTIAHKKGVLGEVASIILSLPSLQWGIGACALAAEIGDLETIQRHGIEALSLGPCDRRLIKYAIRGGHLEVVRWLRSKRHLEWDVTTLADAVETGNVDLVRWMIDNGCWKTGSAFLAAARFNRVEILGLLCERLCDGNAYAAIVAAEKGYLEILKVIDSNGYQWDIGSAFAIADENGHEEMVAWMKQILDESEQPDIEEVRAWRNERDAMVD